MPFSAGTTRELTDVLVVITGASAGIGLACARGFLAEGCHVLLVARGEERLQAVTASLGERAHSVAADVGTDEGMTRVMAAIERTGMSVSVLVNNAGLHHRGAFENNEADPLASMVDVNLRAPIRLSRLLLPQIQSTRGAIVNVASLAGCVPVPNSAVYSATKFGLRAFSVALAHELAPNGVTVSLVSPGPVDTGFIMDDIESVSDLTFSQPIVTAEAVAKAVVTSAKDGRIERKLPVASGRLATFAYVFPAVKRMLQPLLERKGARAKRRLLAKRAQSKG